MKAIKEIKEVRIVKLNSRSYYWSIKESEKYGLFTWCGKNNYKSKRSAINNWVKFAKINGIKNCKIK